MSFAKLNAAVAVLLAGVLLVSGPGGIATTAVGQGDTPSEKKLDAKVKWEYKALTVADIEKLAPKGSQDKLTDGLNALGEHGWELVAVAPGHFGVVGVGGGIQGPGRQPMPPGGPGGPGMPPGGAMTNPGTYLFKRPK
jgi:hypothetical protein